jgi:hypothetical protein
VPHHEAHDEVERDSTDQTVNNDFHASRPKPDTLPRTVGAISKRVNPR